MNPPIVNLSALEPLFAPHEEPNRHRARTKDGQPEVRKSRRPSPLVIAQMLRRAVKNWRETDYPGASDTSRELLHHWFQRDHLVTLANGHATLATTVRRRFAHPAIVRRPATGQFLNPHHLKLRI